MPGDGTQLLEDVLAKSRRHYLIWLAVNVGLLAYFVLTLRTLETTTGKIRLVLLVLVALQLVRLLQLVIPLRKGGPVAAAVVARDQLERVIGWPDIVFPAGKYPAYLRIETTTGKRAKLRVESGIPEVVAALHERSPRAFIKVCNVDVGAAA